MQPKLESWIYINQFFFFLTLMIYVHKIRINNLHEPNQCSEIIGRKQKHSMPNSTQLNVVAGMFIKPIGDIHDKENSLSTFLNGVWVGGISWWAMLMLRLWDVLRRMRHGHWMRNERRDVVSWHQYWHTVRVNSHLHMDYIRESVIHKLNGNNIIIFHEPRKHKQMRGNWVGRRQWQI